MKIAITGATGFIGRHVRSVLVKTDHVVVLVVRNVKKVGDRAANEEIVVADLSQARTDWFELFGKPDAVLHLAWGGLPNYMDSYHVDVELPMQLKFLQSLIDSGLKKLVVAGTCYEYGLSSGAISESQMTNPNTPYGIAKDSLRKALFEIRSKKDFELTWARVFYPYGEGQSENSIYSQLTKAISSDEKEFAMGSGVQMLDFIQVTRVAKALRTFVTETKGVGLINVGSGEPQSVIEFVKKLINHFESNIVPRVGAVADRDYESLSFWSDNDLLDSLALSFN